MYCPMPFAIAILHRFGTNPQNYSNVQSNEQSIVGIMKVFNLQ